MPVATLTTKGQITLPRDVRSALGLAPGDNVDFVAADDGFKLVPLRRDIRDLKGRLAGRVKRPVSVADMDEAIARSAQERSTDGLTE